MSNNFHKSELRLFLSVDVHGSLALKNQKNHNILLELYEQRKKVLSTLNDKGLIDLGSVSLDDNPESIVEILKDYSIEDSDWAAILERRFSDFHDAFAKELSNSKNNNSIAHHFDEFLWKANGDELIYSFALNNRTQLHELVIAFLKVIQNFDKKDIEAQPYRLKGTGWVAGFPIRNRQVTFPGNRVDYLGPDVDAGFRLSKMAHSGLMVVSVELAELLGEVDPTFSLVPGMIVGWQALKSVWDDNPYPIIWITLPEGLGDDYEMFEPWEDLENPFVRRWNSEEKISIGNIRKTIETTRDKMSPRLGLVKPYIVPEDGEGVIPREHKVILKILSSLSPGISGPQDPATTNHVSSDSSQEKEEIFQLWERPDDKD